MLYMLVLASIREQIIVGKKNKSANSGAAKLAAKKEIKPISLKRSRFFSTGILLKAFLKEQETVIYWRFILRVPKSWVFLIFDGATKNSGKQINVISKFQILRNF